jgi:hypothetical protein
MNRFPVDEQSPQSEPDDLTADEVAQSRRKARINGLIFAAVLLLGVVAPPPWNMYAPVLLLIPIVLGLLDRLRRLTIQGDSAEHRPARDDAPAAEPYAYTPKDPKDPRRYKPIG